MTIEQFTHKADGIINDFTGGISDGKEFRDSILDLLIEVAGRAIPTEPLVKPANGGQIGECRMCFEKEKTLHYFDLYVTGSEGIWICEDCRTLITKNIRIIKADNLHKKLQREKASRLSV